MKNITTKADFDSELQGGAGRMILFYSGWCHFCTEFLPVFEKSAILAPGAFARLCVDDLPDIEHKFGVEVVPSVLFFKDGRLVNRLDGVLGRGLTGEKLQEFADACGIKAAR
ncbi:MAG: thioredoxin family protein [Elusimicrobiota bacterium]|nr:thioredoxin family protein [Elusimicrobiota bacterium]